MKKISNVYQMNTTNLNGFSLFFIDQKYPIYHKVSDKVIRNGVGWGWGKPEWTKMIATRFRLEFFYE